MEPQRGRATAPPARGRHVRVALSSKSRCGLASEPQFADPGWSSRTPISASRQWRTATITSKGSPGYKWQQSFAFRFETPDRVIVFSGDTGPCGNVLPEFAKDADILVHEVIDLPAIETALAARSDGTNSQRGQREALMTHMRTEHTTPEEVGRVAQDAAVKMVVLTHLVTGTRTDGDSSYIEAVKRHYSGRVVVARDLMEF